jgi:hypothetical protein
MDDNQRQVLLGALLGNGYLCHGSKNCYFCMRHSTDHLPWLQTKASELTQYGAATPWYVKNSTCTWRSISHPIFTELRQFCYGENGKKQVTMDWLDSLRDVGLAVWYGDSGSLMGRKQRNACLRTQSFGLEGNKIIERYFNEVNLPCNINRSKNSHVIVFTVAGTEALIRLIAHWLPKNRYPKLLAGQFREGVDAGE